MSREMDRLTQEREQFEEWAKSPAFRHKSCQRFAPAHPNAGEYIDQDTFSAWQGWRAGHAFGLAQNAEWKRKYEACHSLLAIHNLGGMTDYNDGPVRRALLAESRLATLTEKARAHLTAFDGYTQNVTAACDTAEALRACLEEKP